MTIWPHNTAPVNEKGISVRRTVRVLNGTQKGMAAFISATTGSHNLLKNSFSAGCSKMPRCKAPEILRSEAYLDVRRNDEG